MFGLCFIYYPMLLAQCLCYLSHVSNHIDIFQVYHKEKRVHYSKILLEATSFTLIIVYCYNFMVLFFVFNPLCLIYELSFILITCI